MQEAALDAGVTLERRTVDGVRQTGDAVEAAGLRARYLVAADGLHSPVRRALGLDAPPTAGRRFGLRRHFTVEPWTSFVEVHWGELARPTSLPWPGHGRRRHADLRPAAPSTSTCAASRAPATGSTRACRRRARRRPAAPARARRVAGRVLLVGDAPGYVDALTGEGVALAVAQARAAVAAVRDGDPSRYEPRVETGHAPLPAADDGLLEATRFPLVRRALVPAATRLPSVFGTAVHALARPA